MSKRNLIEKKALFKYPYYGTPDGFPEHTAHSGQIVTIIKEVDKSQLEPEDEGLMFVVRADDGWEGSVMRDELTVKH